MGVIVLLGAGVGLGLALLVGALAPDRPALASALRPAPPRQEAARAARREEVWGQWLLRRASGLPGMRLPTADLQLLGISPAEHVGKKALLAGAGLLMPWLTQLLALVVGVGLPITVPAAGGLVVAGVLWWAPDRDVRSRARRARTEFLYAMAAYLDLVALQRGADSGPTEALERAARVAGGWAFRRIAGALERAKLEKIPPWEALQQLTQQLQLPALDDIADVMRQSSHDGAAVAATLSKRAEALTFELLEGQAKAANAASEKMTAPGAVMSVLLMLLMAYPAVARLLTQG